MCGARGGEFCVGDVERGLGGVAEHPGGGVACEDVALDADDGGDVGMPVGSGEFVCGIEDADGATFVAIAASVAGVGGVARGGGGGDMLNLVVQFRLVVLELNDQRDVGLCGDLEMFF